MRIVKKPTFPNSPPDRPPYYWAKKSVEKLMALSLLVLLSPALLLIAAVILITDGRPLFYTPLLIGKFGRPFREYKFRTLSKHHRPADFRFNVVDHECPHRFMTFLRNHKLDELPQLINVLIGNMSLIGPRPISAGEAEAFLQDPFLAKLAAYSRTVEPGMSGLWQVTCSKLVDWKKRMIRDAVYVESSSFHLDFRIALLTLSVVAKGERKMIVAEPLRETASAPSKAA